MVNESSGWLPMKRLHFGAPIFSRAEMVKENDVAQPEELNEETKPARTRRQTSFDGETFVGAPREESVPKVTMMFDPFPDAAEAAAKAARGRTMIFADLNAASSSELPAQGDLTLGE